MDREGTPEAEMRVKVGEKEFVLGQEVTVVRTSGEVEKDWVLHGYIRDGVISVVKREGDDTLAGETLKKEVSVERFLEWQDK